MYIQHNLDNRSSELYLLNTHVELNCNFRNSSGDVVYVTGPQATFSPAAPATILKPLSLDQDVVPKYSLKFLTNGMNPGTYTIIGTGTWQSQTLQVSGEFEIFQAPKIQTLIETLRALLHDMIPSLYLVHVPAADTFKWADGELYTALQQALRDMNGTFPTGLNWATVESVPFYFEGHLINIAFLRALNMRQLLEIANVINYSDEIAFNLDKDQKYMAKAQMHAQMWWAAWMSAKKDAAFRGVQSQAIISTRYPLHFIRPLSLLPHSANTFGWW